MILHKLLVCFYVFCVRQILPFLKYLTLQCKYLSGNKFTNYIFVFFLSLKKSLYKSCCCLTTFPHVCVTTEAINIQREELLYSCWQNYSSYQLQRHCCSHSVFTSGAANIWIRPWNQVIT